MAFSSLTDVLSEDALLRIFQFLVDYTRASFHDILNITHVCARWRSVAVHCPTLWTRFALLPRQTSVTASCEDFTDAMLERCQDLPLEAGWAPPLYSRTSPVPETLAQLAHSHRLRAFAFRFSDNDLRPESQVIPALERSSAPRLQDLSIEYIPPHLPAITCLPSTIFQGELASLTHLRLQFCWIGFETLDLPNLIHLQAALVALDYPDELSCVPFTIPAWLGHFAKLPNLRFLHLLLYPPDLPSTTIALETISLEHLTEARLHLNFGDFSFFIDWVCIPKCHTLIVTLTGRREDDLRSYIAKAVEQHASRNGIYSGGSLCISEFLLVTCHRDIVQANWTHKSSLLTTFAITIDIADKATVSSTTTHLSTFLDGWTPVLKHITSIRILFDPKRYAGPIKEFIAGATALQSLACCASAVEALVGDVVDEGGQCVVKARQSVSVVSVTG